MKRIMLVGQSGSGKRKIIQACSDESYIPKRALAVEYHDCFINTPSEFLENRLFYPALITTSSECDILLMLHNATHATSLYPPLFGSMFNRRVIGVITSADAKNAKIKRAEQFLHEAGAKRILCVDYANRRGIETLREIFL